MALRRQQLRWDLALHGDRPAACGRPAVARTDVQLCDVLDAKRMRSLIGVHWSVPVLAVQAVPISGIGTGGEHWPGRPADGF